MAIAPELCNDSLCPVRWNRDIDRNVWMARFYRGQKSDQHFRFFVTDDGDRRLVAGITLREMRRERVGSFPQLAVGQRSNVTDVGNLIWKDLAQRDR